MINTDDIMMIGDLTTTSEPDDKWVFNRIDEILQESVDKHTGLIALNAGRQLREISRVSGLGLAKLIYGMQKNWAEYNDVNDDFEDTVTSYIDIHRDNVLRYANVWALFDQEIVPEELKEEMQTKNIMDLIPVGLAIQQGYEIEQGEWEKIADASNLREVAKVLREDVKHKPPRKSSIQLYMNRDGTLWAFQDEERYFIGSLEINDDQYTVQKAIARILNNSGIIRQ